ncbi:MAG: hypothetical protein O9292_13045 [Rhodobacteraceae bacterium]|nr:hypothetical protein [Paracoccaceae bacterium]
MTRILYFALISALAVTPMLTAPAAAGGIVFDLPNLTWPEGTAVPQTGTDVVLGTKSATRG